MRDTPKYALLLALVVGTLSPALSAEKPKAGNTLNAVTTNDVYRPFLINNVFNYYSNNGDGSYNKFSTDNEGFEFSIGSGKHLIFEDGVVWGGKHKSALKVGGSAYRHGLQAGPISVYGTGTTGPVAADSADVRYRIYRVRPDINPGVTFEQVQAELVKEVGSIGRYESYSAQDLYNQYVADWNAWPADEGAPYKDVDGNGVYNPTVDIPGVPGADQTLWYVSNDLSTARVANLAGSAPIGLEVQKTIWGYNRSGALGNTIFISTLLINKSGAPIDSMFIVQWADPDLGDAGDDFAGCDTTRSLGYIYNGNPTDATYGSQIPAGGFTLLQGPMVDGLPGDTATFRGRYHPGFKNLPMSAFVFFTSGNATYADPRQGPGGDIEWYRLMNARIASSGNAFIDPTTGKAAKFTLYGDPVAGTGWLDGTGGLIKGDRRICMVTGPFTMATGDTQEIVVANLAGLGADRLSSVTTLRSATDQVRSAFMDDLVGIPAPPVMVSVSYQGATQVGLVLKANTRGMSLKSLSGVLRTPDGASYSPVTFYDDGTHGDATAGDGVFTDSLVIFHSWYPLSLDLTGTNTTDQVFSWKSVTDWITVAGELQFSVELFADNINSDGKVNPGETFRYGITTKNTATEFTFSALTVVSTYNAFPSAHTIPYLGYGGTSSGTATMTYDANNPSTYFTGYVPASFSDSVITIGVTVHDTVKNKWYGTVTLPVSPMTDTLKTALITHLRGPSTGEFQISMVDPSALTNHLYVIYGVDSINSAGDNGFTLKDSTDGRVLLLNHPLPDSLGFTVPVTDGFKVLRGTIALADRYSTYEVPSGTRRWTWSGANASGYALEGFNGAIGNAMDFWGSSVGKDKLRTVLIKLAATDTSGNLLNGADTTASYGYRFLRGCQNPAVKPAFAPFIKNTTASYAFQDYVKGVPLAAYDMETNPPTRLAVAFLENNVAAGMVDGKYWPPVNGTDNSATSSAREWLFIMAAPYTGATADPAITSLNLISDLLPLMWVSIADRRVAADPYADGDQFLIRAAHPPASADAWTFSPSVLAAVRENGLPAEFALSQNYPNPFNPATTIGYTVGGIGDQGSGIRNVKLTIYNVLGQEVATLVNEKQAPGRYTVRFDASRLASGVYLYRLSAGSFMETRKMLLIK